MENNKFDFSDLFTLDMANNHQGSLSHGLKIIREHSKIIKKHGVRGSIKFQFRDLDTFIHPEFREDKNNKHVSRFLSTKLSKDDFNKLAKAVRDEKLVTMATPFDEKSVNLIEDLNIEVVKIASCSAKDWPLLERVIKTKKPIIVSTGGLTLKDIDNLVSFLQHKYADFAIMHCVSVYPTPDENLELNQVEFLKKRYPSVIVGFSTHEDPKNITAIQIAVAKGAKIFERHIGIKTNNITLNSYSSTPSEIDAWINSYKKSVLSCGSEDRLVSSKKETEDLRSLMRGVFVNKNIKKGDEIKIEDVFFAIPIQSGQLASGEFRPGIIADKNYRKWSGIQSSVRKNIFSKKEKIYEIIHTVKGMLNEARIPMSHDYGVELSHHYGIENFDKTGIVIIDCVNREYCKKIIIQLPGQSHPSHHHLKKEETFHVLFGELELELEGKFKILLPGDIQTIPRGVRHSFSSKDGVIFEEISTTHHNDDSMYEDIKISEKAREDRKTKLINWGRYQFD